MQLKKTNKQRKQRKKKKSNTAHGFIFIFQVEKNQKLKISQHLAFLTNRGVARLFKMRGRQGGGGSGVLRGPDQDSKWTLHRPLYKVSFHLGPQERGAELLMGGSKPLLAMPLLPNVYETNLVFFHVSLLLQNIWHANFQKKPHLTANMNTPLVQLSLCVTSNGMTNSLPFLISLCKI